MVGKSRRCEVCGVRESVVNGFFASFPKDEHRCKIWVQIVGQEDLLHVPIEKLNEERHVCGNHFDRRDFGRSGKRLKLNAYPRLNLTAPPLSDWQLSAFPLHVASQVISTFRTLAPITLDEAASSAPVASSSKTRAIVTTQNNIIDPNTCLHTFPSPFNIKKPEELERFRTWVMRIGGEIVGETDEYIFRNRKICTRHFEDIYTSIHTKRLSCLAIPTLFLSDPNTCLHTFPSPCNIKKPEELERFRTWVMRIGGKIVGEPDEHIFRNRKVCTRHFSTQDIYSSLQGKRLSWQAIPTLFLSGIEDILHKFPHPNKDPQRFNSWVYAVGGPILSLANDHIMKYRRVCHIHFEEKYWCSGKHVSYNAIPTKHLSEHSVKFYSNNDSSCLRPILNAATPGEPTSDGVPLHRFPCIETNPERFKSWISIIDGGLSILDPGHVYNNKRVCRKHFEKCHKYPRNRLCKLALPVLHIPGSMELRRMGNSEHSYARKCHYDHSYSMSISANYAVAGSSHNTAVADSVQFTQCMHRFPHPTKNRVFYDAWVSSVGDILKEKNCLKVYSSKRICDKHFIYSHKISKNRLLPWAVPVYLNRVRQSIITYVECDHNYTFVPRGHPEPASQANAAARNSARAVALDHKCTTKRFHIDHTYVKFEDDEGEKWMEQLTLPDIPGKTSTAFQSSEARLQGETHKDHTYVADRIITLPAGTQRYEKCIDIDADPDVKDTQIDADPEIVPIPEVEETFDPDYEVPVSPSSLPDVEDSGGEAVFSWQKEEELIEADEPEADPTLALYCDPDPNDPKANADPDPDPDADADLIFDPQPDQAVPSVPVPVDNRCKDCGEVNEGFDFWCVQCAGGALCGACAGRPPHHAHYVLRAPMGCSRARTQAVLTLIRQQLQDQNLSQHGTVDDELKLEVKEEPAEPPPAASLAAEPDPLACEPREPISLYEPEFTHELIQPQQRVSLREPHSPISLDSRPDSPHSPISLHSRPDSPLSPHAPASPHEPAVTPEPATHEADKCIAKIFDHHEPLQPPRLRKRTNAHEEILSIPTQRKLVKVSPAEVKRAFRSHIERVVTTQTKQLKVFPPNVKLTSIVRKNVVATQHKEPYDGNSRTTRLQVRGSQAPLKVTSEPKPSEIVTIDLDITDETVEYLEEGLESDIETVDNVDNHEDDVLDVDDILDEDDFDDDVLDEDYLLNDDDLEDDLSDEERIKRNVPSRGVKRKKDPEETLPVKGPSELMARALPSKAVIQVRPLSSLEIRKWTADKKRLRKD